MTDPTTKALSCYHSQKNYNQDMPGGRPSAYTQEVANTICQRLMDDESLRQICRDPEMPAMSSVFKWLTEKPEFSAQYREARDVQCDIRFEKVHDLPFECEQQGLGADYTRLKMDGAKWAASRGNPKKYGDKQIIGHDPDMPATIAINEADKEILQRYIDATR